MTVVRFLAAGVIVSLLAGIRPAHADEAPIEVPSGWMFRPGDSPVGADGRPLWITEATPSASWRPMNAFSSPELDTNGLVWVRVPLPTGDWRDPTLFFDRWQGAVEVYTSHRLDELGHVEPSGIEEAAPGWRMVPVAREDLGHALFLRLQISRHPPSLGQALRLGDRGDHLVRIVSEAVPTLMVTGILLALGLLLIGGFLLRPADASLLHCAGFSLCSACLLAGLTDATPLVLDVPGFWRIAVPASAVLMAPFLAAFMTTAILARRYEWFTRIVQVLFAAGLAWVLALLVDSTLMSTHVLLAVPLIIGGLLASLAVGIREALRGNPDAQIFSLGAGVLFLLVSIDGLTLLGVTPGWRYHSYFGFLAVTLSLAVVTVRRHLVMRGALEKHMTESEARHGTVARLSGRLAESTGVLVGAVGRLRQSSSVQSGVVDRQAATLQEILATAQEINQASRLAAEKATAIMTSAGQADEANRSIGQAVEAGLGGIAAMGREVAEMANRIRALEQRTRQIAGIVDTVKGLADQSNMLALNAAIEAVRSGDAGKGFVVVAREMRSLADLSIQATARIREVLANVNDGIREAAEASERGEARTEGSLKQLQASGAQLRSLSQIVHESSASVRQISAAIGQQSVGVSQVFTALNDLSRQMDETVDRLKETREAASAVEAVADAMSAALKESASPQDSARPAPAGPAMKAA